MGLDGGLLELLTNTVSHAAYVSQDSYGAPTYATPVSRPARVDYTVRRIVNAQGDERVSMARVFLDGAVVIRLRDILTLADGTSPAIQRIASPKDLDGTVHHHEVSL